MMVVDESTRGDTGTALPLLTLHSMTQSQLKELIPQLVTKVTGRTSPLFGSIGDKPDWWPCDLEWTSPEELADKYKNPCERLREIVRSCYCYMDQDSLLNSSEEFSSEVPVSPAVGDTDVSASDPDTELPSVKQVELVSTDVKKDFDEKLIERDSRMTIQSKTRPIENIEKCSERVEQAKSPAEETTVHSGCNKIESGNNTEHSRMSDVKTKGAAVDATESNSVQDCQITGMSINTTQDISADVIAQIDFEIAKSLNAAFKSIGTFGLTNPALMNDGNTGRNSPLSHFNVDKGLQMKQVNKRSSAEEIRQQTATVKPFSEINKLLHKKPAHIQQRSVNTEKTLPELGRLLTKPVSMTVRDASINNANINYEKMDSTKRIETHFTEDEQLPDIVKEDNKEEKHEDDVVWICFVCAKGFANQSELMKHQDVCEEEQNNLDTVFKSSQTVSPKGHSVLPKSQPVPALLRKVGSSLKSLPLGLPNVSTVIRKRQRKFEDIYIPPSRDVYFESLGLFPTPRVEAISKSPRKSVTDEDCQIIDLTVDDPQAVPMTPRTRSMLSQLSRDDSSGRRRQLSFSQNAPPAQEKEQKEEVDFKELSEDSDSSEEEETVQKHKIPSKSAILGIPLTSPLGQRLKKHWNYENKVPVIEDIEMFCKTDAPSLLHIDRNKTKNPMVEKLRNRPPPQCTFRFTKKYVNKWCHSYKFNKADKKEFKKRLKFRLDRDSRIKLKRMKKCRVLLARLSQKDIKYWTNPRPKLVQRRFLPETTMLPQFNRQYRVNQIQNAMASSTASRPTQGALYNQLLQPLRFGAPTPQLLVRSVPMGVQGMRLQVLPIQQAQNQNIFLSSPSNLMHSKEMTRSQKRKQVFNNVREDDNMVICLSSDEEEEIVIKPQSRTQQPRCAMCIIYKNNCKIHGKRRIGPASFMRQLSNNAEVATSPQIDKVTSRPDTIIAGSTVNMSQSAQYANTASARIFGSSIRPSVQYTQCSAQPKANYTHMKIADGTAAVIHNVSNASGSVPVHQDASVTVQGENATGSAENDKNGSQSAESDYMDYEVICIDSDEDN